MKTQTQLERRASPRIPHSVSLRYASYQDDYSQSAIGAAQTVDISATGMQIALSEAVKVPAYVQIAVRLAPHTAPIILLGKTIWCHPAAESGHRAGVQFVGHIDPTFKQFVETQAG